jgi:hypothetical protein
MRLFQNFSFGTATLDLIEKMGLDRFFESQFHRKQSLRTNRVLELAQI